MEETDAVQNMDTMQDEAAARERVAANRQRAMDGLGLRLAQRFVTYESERKPAEDKWIRNLRQFLGEYDPEVKSQLSADRSQAYPRVTRVKCMTTVARLMHMMFPSSEKNWTVSPSPVPNLPMEVMQPLLAQVQQMAMEAQQSGAPVNLSELVEAAVVEEAEVRARRMEKEIEDQLAELGGGRTLDYIALCRKVVASGVIYGAGVLGGPFVREQMQRTWATDPVTGMVTPQETSVMRPQYEFVPLWDYYPDMSAKTWDQMDGQFQRYVMSRHQVRALADRPDFFGDVIKEYLAKNQSGNYMRKTYETELKSMGVTSYVGDGQGRKYELLRWEGYVYANELAEAGIDVPDDMLSEDVLASVWLLGNKVVKADLNPWYRLTGDPGVKMYHHFVYEEDDTALIGNGVPNILRDSQLAIAAAARMALDNGAVTCGPQIEVNLDLLRPDQDLKSIGAFRAWYREGTGADAAIPAIREIKLDAHVPELISLMDVFKNFADMETFVNPATGGDMSAGPSEPFRTATGASILKGDAALPFKDVVRNFDSFTQSVIGSLLAFNDNLSVKQDIKGDYQVIPRGAMSLVAKEIRGMLLDQYLMSLQPEERPFVKWYDMTKERGATRDMPVDKIYVSEKEAEGIMQQQSERAAKEAQDQEELMRASVRKILAESLKNLTQADKNNAAAATAVFKTMLEGLQNGVTPQEVAAVGNAGNYVPVQNGPGQPGGGGLPAQPQGEFADTIGFG